MNHSIREATGLPPSVGDSAARIMIWRRPRWQERNAMELSRQERAILVEHLLATLDPGDDVDSEELWLQEAEKRYAEYRAGKIGGKPLAATSPEYLASIREARQDYREGHIITAEELFKD